MSKAGEVTHFSLYFFQLREINFYKEGDLTHYKQKMENVNIERCWQECMERSRFHHKRRQVDQFNR